MNGTKPSLFSLFLTFAKVGVMTFGGGMAMLPILQREVTDNKGWATEEELMDYYAIGQCTPGIIAVNTATFIGRKQRGSIGGIIATLGMVFPSLVIIIMIAALLDNFSAIPAVKSAFAGIRVCVCVLIFNSIIKLGKSGIKDRAGIIIAAAVLLLSVFFDLSPILFVIACAAAGIILTGAGVRGR